MSIIETYQPQHPRLRFFYFVTGMLVAVLFTGLAYRQLFRAGDYGERERLQNQRRVLIPGPRGNIYDRNGRPLVLNRPHFSATVELDALRREFQREYQETVRRYRESEAAGDTLRSDRPSPAQLEQIARVQVVQRYLDQVNRLLGRSERVDAHELNRHFQQQLLLPYAILDDLKPEEYAKLLERLPVESPLQLYASSTRDYPYKSAAAHALGYVRASEEISGEEVPGEDLRTYALPGTAGRDGLELRYDSLLQGETGGAVYRVDPAGFRVNPPVSRRAPVQGYDLITSLDIDLQLAVEAAMEQYAGDLKGSAVVLDVHTGEVLVLASKPGYDLNAFSPHLSLAAKEEIDKNEAWTNFAIAGAYPAGSTFKIVTSIAGMRSGQLNPETVLVDCTGAMYVGNRRFTCDNGLGHHGPLSLREGIAQSCDVYFYTAGIAIGPDIIAAEARRLHLDQRTGIDLPHETTRMRIPDPEWKKQTTGESWTKGDTANMAIGQGAVNVTPMQMACFVASVARGETTTAPSLVHDPDRPPQHSEPLGLTPSQLVVLYDGMEGCVTHGTAAQTLAAPKWRIPGLRIAGKTGTAQTSRDGKKINIAWFICFAPRENPQIAVAVAIEGEPDSGNLAGGLYAAPIAASALRTWFEKSQRTPLVSLTPNG